MVAVRNRKMDQEASRAFEDRSWYKSQGHTCEGEWSGGDGPRRFTGFDPPGSAAIGAHADDSNADRLFIKPGNVERSIGDNNCSKV